MDGPIPVIGESIRPRLFRERRGISGRRSDVHQLLVTDTDIHATVPIGSTADECELGSVGEGVCDTVAKSGDGLLNICDAVEAAREVLDT